MLRLGNWELIFVFLLAVALALIALVQLALHETLRRPDPHALKPSGVWRNALSVASDPRSSWSMLFMTFTYAGLMAYLLSASALYIGWFGLGEGGFALVFALVAATSFVTQPLNARLLRRYEPFQIVGVALPAFALVGAAMLAQALTGVLSLASFVISLSAFFACFAFTMGNGTTMALDPHQERAGIASGLLGFAQLALGTALGALIGGFAEHGPVALATGLTVLGLLAYPCYRLALRRGGGTDERLT
jgi:DHA1 family bicyclomycin/chloramphenicol resistance-like MFS transporter